MPKSTWWRPVYVNGVEVCNPSYVSFKERDYKAIRTITHPLAPKRLTTQVLDAGNEHTARWDHHSRPSILTFTGDAISYFDTCEVWNLSNSSNCSQNAIDGNLHVFSLIMDQEYTELYYTDYEEGVATCSFDMDGAPEVPHAADDEILSEQCYIFRIFQKPYAEELRPVATNTKNPRSILASPEGNYLAWIEYLSEEHTVIRVYDRQKLSNLPEDMINSGEPLSGPDNLTNIDSIIIRQSLVYCGENTIIYQATDSDGNTGIFARTLSNSDYSVQILARNASLPIASHVETSSSSLSSSSTSSEICIAGWRNAADESISIVQLPSMNNTKLWNADWIDEGFDELIDMTLASNFLLVVVRNSATNEHKIRFAEISNARNFQDLENSTWPREISLSHRDSESALTYFLRGENSNGIDDELRLIRIKSLPAATERSPDALQIVHCALEAPSLRPEYNDTKRIIDASVFRDTVVWLAELYEGGPKVFELMDLDKDNDGLFDILDDFPVNYGFSFDSDGDGYADERDFIDFPGLNDDLIMYCVFVTFMVVCAALFLFHIKMREYLERRWSLIAQKIHEQESNQNTTEVHRYSAVQQQRTAKVGPLRAGGDINSEKEHSDSSVNLFGRSGTQANIVSSPIVHLSPVAQKNGPQTLSQDRALQSKISKAITRKTRIGNVARRLSAVAINAAFRNKYNAEIEEQEADLRAQVWYDHAIERSKSVGVATETFVLLLTVISIIIAVAPLIPYGGVSAKTERVLIWIDVFNFGIFFLDFTFRCLTRDKKELPTVRSFFSDNWYDIPAMLTEIPLTAVWFPDAMRLFKGFRLFRLYRRFTQQAIFISLMVRKPMAYLASFVVVIILICTVFIKIFEQNHQEDFRDFSNVIWFALVTVTTVGYGDYKVTQIETQILMFILMLIGIGLISTLSAFSAERIVSVGLAEETKRQMKQDLVYRSSLLREGLFHIAEPYNPVSVALEDLYSSASRAQDIKRKSMRVGKELPHREKARTAKQGSIDDDDDEIDVADDLEKHMQELKWRSRNFDALGKHRSSLFNVTVGMKAEVQLPIEKFMEGAGGKFRINAISSQADLIRAVAKEHDQSMLLECLQKRRQTDSQQLEADDINTLSLTPRTRLEFLLLRFSLDKPERGGVHNFSELVMELADILFEPPRPRALPLEKVYSIQEHWNALCDKITAVERPQFYYYDLRDPLHEKLARVDEHLVRYGIAHRSDYNELITELSIVLLLHERVRTVQWALKNLEFAPEADRAEAVLEAAEPRRAEMPNANIILTGQNVDMVDEHGGEGDQSVTEVLNGGYRLNQGGARRGSRITPGRLKTMSSGRQLHI